MSENIQAIFENGVLRPLQPLHLDEHEVVWVSVEKRVDQNGSPVDAEIAQQQQAIDALLDRMKKMPLRAPGDGFSNRDHR